MIALKNTPNPVLNSEPTIKLWTVAEYHRMSELGILDADGRTELIADSTLKQDCQVKDKLYANAGISEYWVVDIKNRQVNIFRNPTSTGYANHLILKEPNEFSPLAFPHISIELTSILPPVT